MITSALTIWWTVSAARGGLIRALPALPAEAGAWQSDLQTAAGLDVLALVVVGLWVVLAMRLPIQLWLRVLAASAAVFAVVVVIVAMSISNAAAAHVGASRSRCVLDGDFNTPRVIIGSTPQHMATLVVYDANGQAVIELRNHPDAITVTGRQSIVDYLAERVPQEE